MVVGPATAMPVGVVPFLKALLRFSSLSTCSGETLDPFWIGRWRRAASFLLGGVALELLPFASVGRAGGVVPTSVGQAGVITG